MSKWSIIHRVRYPPFDDKRLHADAVPISEKIIETNLSDEKIQLELPPYKIESEEGWLIERKIVDDEGNQYNRSTSCRKDERAFVQLIEKQRKGWYILPNRLHGHARQMINIAVIFLLSTLVYLFLD